MSTKALLDDGTEQGGVQEVVHFDANGELKALERRLDVEPLLEANKSAYNIGLQNRASEFRRVASYDPVTIDIFCKKWGIDQRALWKDKRMVSRLLNDPDLRHFRTLPGTV